MKQLTCILLTVCMLCGGACKPVETTTDAPDTVILSKLLTAGALTHHTYVEDLDSVVLEPVDKDIVASPDATEEVLEETTEVIEEVVEEIIEEPEGPKLVSLGVSCITAYCPCYECSEGWENQTATGVRAQEGVTIAVDPDVIPYGSKVYINGHEYIAQDCGGSIDGNDIDIFFDTHSETIEWGERWIEIFILEE